MLSRWGSKCGQTAFLHITLLSVAIHPQMPEPAHRKSLADLMADISLQTPTNAGFVKTRDSHHLTT
jgi:hypothetical protein